MGRGRGCSGSSTFSVVTDRKQLHPTLDVAEKKRLILGCLKEAICPMDVQSIRSWIGEHEQVWLGINETFGVLRHMLHDNLVAHASPVDRRWIKVKP